MPSLFPEAAAQPSAPTSRANPEAWVNAHCDGGARGNPGPAGYGAVLVDDTGTTLAELSEFLGVRTNNVAEYAGLLAVLGWALEHGQRRVRVTSDSLLMVKQMKGQYKVNSPDLKPMWEEARRRAKQLDAFEITHALRHKNKVADRLANEAMDRGMGKGGQPKALPMQATPYPARTSTPPQPARLEEPREKPGLFAAPQSPAASPAAAKAPELLGIGIVGADGATVAMVSGASLPPGTRVRVMKYEG